MYIFIRQVYVLFIVMLIQDKVCVLIQLYQTFYVKS